MSASNRVGRWAKLSLLAALAVAIAGLLLRDSGAAPLLGGMLLACGEAALVGGLADWFAVRALFAHPFGIPFPHSALIPRNRRRIVAEIRGLVENEWLPRPMLVARINAFDFVADAILPFVHSHKERLQDLLRTVARNVLTDILPEQVAGFLARAAGRAIEADEIQTFAARLLRRAREEGWLEPLLEAMLKRLGEWASSVESHTIIYRHLEQAGSAYRDQGWFKNFTYQVAEVFGGVDLHNATSLLQNEIRRFAAEQGTEKAQLKRVLAEGMANVERRLREDPDFLSGVGNFLAETSNEGTLPALLEPVVASVHAQALRELDVPESPLLGWVLGRLDGWLHGVAEDEKAREQVNAWCRHLAETLVERHHPIIGMLVEEQLNRLSDESLVELIEKKVGEDLNWIRLNGTFVGGMIGLALYLLFALIGGMTR
ncbi:MAG: DUF445 domain-containing protein [Planctomycetes bacterium]|nr:DUF445 domain-containing protein [Planctomycetota bacterium]